MEFYDPLFVSGKYFGGSLSVLDRGNLINVHFMAPRLPETNSSHLKTDGWKMNFLLDDLFSGAMSVLGNVSPWDVGRSGRGVENERRKAVENERQQAVEYERQESGMRGRRSVWNS